MSVRFPASEGWLRRGGRLSVRLCCVTALLSLFALTLAAWSRHDSPVVLDRLVPHQPYDIILRDGQGTVDLYLEQDVPVRLLVSNLGSVSRNAALQVRSERLSATARYQPQPWKPKPAVTRLIHCENSLLKPPARQQPTSPHALARDFWLHVTDTPLENPQGYQLVHSRMAACQQTAEVYVDSSLNSPAGIPPAIEQLANEIAIRLSRDVLPTITHQIGPIADPDQNGRLTVLLTPWLGRLRGGTTQVRGFVRSSDLRTEIAAPFSNHADLLYLNPDLPAGDALQSLLLHEVAHTALASRPSLSSSLARPDWDDWLNEGLAHLTEQTGRDEWSNLDYRIAKYWQDSASAPLLVRDYYRTGRWRNHGCRGATFLFLDWCQQQARKRGVTNFVPALMATGKADQEAVEQVCQAPFADLYRAWTVSLATESAMSKHRKIGRFLNSGPRFQPWNLTADPAREISVSGSATQFVELHAARSGWYRLEFAGDPLDSWQLTVIPTSQASPCISLMATWSRGESSEPMSLEVGSQESLPAGWQLDEVGYELIREPHPRARNWPAASLLGLGNASNWPIKLPLSSEDILGADAVIKVRFKNSTGQVAWSWVEVPASGRIERIADGSRH